jgi:hypothetical protein
MTCGLLSRVTVINVVTYPSPLPWFIFVNKNIISSRREGVWGVSNSPEMLITYNPSKSLLILPYVCKYSVNPVRKKLLQQ